MKRINLRLPSTMSIYQAVYCTNRSTTERVFAVKRIIVRTKSLTDEPHIYTWTCAKHSTGYSEMH